MWRWAAHCARTVRAWVIPRLALTLLCVFALVLALRVTETLGPDGQQRKVVVDAPAGPCPASGRVAVRCEVNAFRAAHGLPALRGSPELGRAAHAHAVDMVVRGYFSHVTPDGRDVRDRARSAGFIRRRTRMWRVGENIGWGQGELARPASIVDAWEASPGHRAVMLTRVYRQAGVGIAQGTPQGTPGVTYVLNVGARQLATRGDVP